MSCQDQSDRVSERDVMCNIAKIKFKGQSMDAFKSFHVVKKSVPEKRIPYYVNWVRRFQDTSGKGPDDPFTRDEVRRISQGNGPSP